MLAALVAAIVGGTVVWRDATVLFHYPFPVGVDGFYYAQQIKSILTSGRLYYPSRTPLVFYLIAGVCGRHGDIVKCIKLTSTAMELSLFSACWVLLWRLTLSSWIALCGIAIIAALPSHLFLVADFTKELLCFALLAWCAVCIQAAILRRSRLLYCVGAVLFLLATFSHKSAPMVVVTLAIGIGVLKLSGRRRYLVGVAILAAWCVGFVVEFRPSVSLLLDKASLRLPPGGSTWWTAERLAILAAGIVILLISMGSTESRKLPTLTFATVALLALCITVNPWVHQNSDFVFGRASMTANLQLGLLVSGLLYARHKDGFSEALWPVYSVLAGFVCLSIASPPQVRGLDPEYLSRRTQLVDVLQQTNIAERDAIVIAPQGDQFAVTYLTGLPSQRNWPAGRNVAFYWLLLGVPSTVSASPELFNSAQASWYVLKSDISLRKEWPAYDEETRDQMIQNNPELLAAGYSP